MEEEELLGAKCDDMFWNGKFVAADQNVAFDLENLSGLAWRKSGNLQEIRRKNWDACERSLNEAQVVREHETDTNECSYLWQPRLRAAACDVSMQMDRRAVAGVILAAPAAAFASAGDSPKQAYFATAPASSPFGETYTNRGNGLWQELGEMEREIYTRIARATKDQLTDVSPRCFECF